MTLEAAVAITLVALAGLLVVEARGSRAGVWILKPLASMGFIAAGLAAGALASPYGRLVLIGLVFGFVGDVALIPRAHAAFLVGLGSFLVGHLAYAVAFLVRGAEGLPLALTALVLAGPALAVVRWLRPHAPPKMLPAIEVYIAAIVAMVACAAGTAARASSWVIAAGALLFFLSDLAVARNRFVRPGFANRLWGWPFYYAGQLLLASSVAQVR